MKRIVIMAGGTGGHVFPALAVAQSLRAKGWQVSWLGTQKGLESRVVPEQGIDIDWLAVAGVRGKGLLSKLAALFKLVAACVQAARILRQRKPDVVLGMGGFVAGPGGLMARVLGIPLVIHEQNRVPGTTNRLLAKMASQVLEAFPGSFPKKNQAQCTGNPLRSAFVQHLAAKPAASDPLHIFVVGGSLGAQILNEIVPEAMALLSQVRIKHQTGAVMCQQVTEHYRHLGIDAEVSPFIDDMAAAYLWADLVVCRAGAMTVSEVSAMGVPAIFIPLPGAIDDHQTANARYLTEAQAGLLLMQKDLTASRLAENITEARQHLAAMSQAARQCARLDATEVVAEICMAEAKP
ncbi:undecaprenyldiphospho-muramoylpentapeptide beta-N-acetylglucosaminyltransferase [Methylovulum psychrotolerans]|jgi:UDP-N-acetylglucosamine--N-acetylmuramyl-(pentapeptide) pyrophosphoryl-undecaprenol N-acetylglucosamine transferase|uniref:UDP-N-acetylglucosamine--N-acetylmuramyl-(pentapeptide) pyrophosphoryl-undecaprenol N-acetylglucosamine transferase n=1 Tax=Methylovulum psychrotolerans TaxID=1704499 RepID=A0A1Z4C001_9GAMM|nr:undecaprenyldiphospho-muramoylpentapeptide beta-N-acetylglucosaminyltransferase [Methylovulum psychrotolerans]ASF46874.1 undecaprenyldiphospho-muramoylpentapeptide beta-N-acetylglucosaminyltransferase [Methylovulum psychrotolerans]POZ50325.1 undecaprenyldiphospho-muramoylpentapeptide beta-N-acetylglucosaminyltransferase [Methylovulum psychrotolerans]